MTAAAVIWPNGRLEVYGAFPSIPGLRARGEADNVGPDLYCRMEARGELAVYSGRTTPVSEFLRDIGARLAGQRVISAGADRYRRSEVIDALEQASLAWPVVWRGQGAAASADGSHDLRAFRRMVLEKGIKSTKSLLMSSAISESSVRYKLQNPALDKARSKSRIDALSATLISCGLLSLSRMRKPRSVRYRGVA